MWGDWTHRHHLHPLASDAAAQVMLDLAPHAGTREQAALLGRSLSGVPLLLHLAGKALAETTAIPARWAAPGTLRQFTDYQHALTAGEPTPGLDDKDGEERHLGALFARTWEISLDQLQKTGQAHARALLLLICCFGDAPLPYELVLTPSTLATTNRFEGITPAHLTRTLTSLHNLGLIALTPTDDTRTPPRAATLALHPVIRTAARSHTDLTGADGNTYWRLATQLLLDAAEDLGAHTDSTQAWSQLSAHAADTLSHRHIEPGDEEASTHWNADDWRVEYVIGRGADQLASNGLHYQALALYDALIGISPDPASRYRQLRACMLGAIGRHGEALAEFDAVLAARRELHGEGHAYVLITRDERARVLSEMGRHGEALAEFDAPGDSRQDARLG
ncbi:MAG: tetratricopeptide repeat protein [Kineosporiaceae bacterium]|nr:tetratricopeptide repeat protein [Kineosporiaceae bacterium]